MKRFIFLSLSLLLFSCGSNTDTNVHTKLKIDSNQVSKIDSISNDDQSSVIVVSSKPGTKCTIYGDKPIRKFMILDSLKNRSQSASINSKLSLTDILTFKGDDTKQYNSNNYVELTGYVILVKYGGSETCNCHSTDKNDMDIHIELALTPTSKNVNAMVLEINRYSRGKDSLLRDIANIRKFVGKKVTVQGFMFLDDEHLQNAVTTNPTGTDNWRYTCWELHPLLSIKEFK